MSDSKIRGNILLLYILYSFLESTLEPIHIMCNSRVVCLCLTTFCIILNKKIYYIKFLLLLSFNFSKWIFRLIFIFLRHKSVRVKRLIFLLISLIIAYTETLVEESLETVFVLPKIWKRFYFKKFVFFLFFKTFSKTTICSLFKLSGNATPKFGFQYPAKNEIIIQKHVFLFLYL